MITLNHNTLIGIIATVFIGLGLIVGLHYGILRGIVALAVTMPIILIELFVEKMWIEVNRLDGRRREAIQADGELDRFA